MSVLKRALRRLLRLPGIPQARHVTERLFAPYLRDDLHSINLDLIEMSRRLERLGLQEDVPERLAAIERHQPVILNAIASSNGTARLLRRELDESLRQQQQQMQPHLDTISYLLRRVETVRAEMLHELRYGQLPTAGRVEPRIINTDAVSAPNLRLNLGAGHVLIDGYINVDLREMPGIDVVAAVDALPFEPASLAEISSSHLLEHFPEEQLRRQLFPYWFGLLTPGGHFRAIVPDMEAMTTAYTRGETSFGNLRAVTYGGQEYEGDFHYTGFTPDSLSDLLLESGFASPELIANARPNGSCLEFEIVATRPSV